MNQPTFVYVTYINTTAGKLWEALTTTALIRQYWSGRTNESTWRKGAPLESRSPAGELEWHGKILENKRPRRLSYSFKVVGTREGPSRVRFDIKTPKRSDSHRTRAIKLTVTHDQFPAGSKVHPGVEEGWPTILSSLKTLLETGQAIRFTFES
jgi:uncharacterized protein YndB with AHSA1/START domain